MCYSGIMEKIQYSVVGGMAQVEQGPWDSLAVRYGSPFLLWGFLALLEASGSVAENTGWLPCHMIARRAGALIAAAPFYLRSHSMGDFVFDFSVAEAAESIGAKYYPKLVGTIPLTPVPVWRVMTAPGEESAASGLLEYASGFAARTKAGGIHFLWVDPEFETFVRGGSRVEWKHQGYLWRNGGYADFSGYLSAFSKNMRRNILRERSSIAAAGIVTRIIPPALATPSLLGTMHRYYCNTNEKFFPWDAKYLNESFFSLLPQYLPQGWLLSAAYEGDKAEPVALALLFDGGHKLFGRYWGCERDIDSLHFELCYYLPIEYAIQKGYAFFDPGMGGHHKARRGFESILTSSFHDVFDQRISRALGEALRGANEETCALARELDKELPFKRGTPA